MLRLYWVSIYSLTCWSNASLSIFDIHCLPLNSFNCLNFTTHHIDSTCPHSVLCWLYPRWWFAGGTDWSSNIQTLIQKEQGGLLKKKKKKNGSRYPSSVIASGEGFMTRTQSSGSKRQPPWPQGKRGGNVRRETNLAAKSHGRAHTYTHTQNGRQGWTCF